MCYLNIDQHSNWHFEYFLMIMNLSKMISFCHTYPRYIQRIMCFEYTIIWCSYCHKCMFEQFKYPIRELQSSYWRFCRSWHHKKFSRGDFPKFMGGIFDAIVIKNIHMLNIQLIELYESRIFEFFYNSYLYCLSLKSSYTQFLIVKETIMKHQKNLKDNVIFIYNS